MNKYQDQTYVGERALFATNDGEFYNCTFKDGESPLKESGNLTIRKCNFLWKYPIWYCHDVVVDDSFIANTARSGIWYTKNITIRNSSIESPKTFRWAEKVVLENCSLPNAQETLWNCRDVRMTKVSIRGDYLGFHAQDVEIDQLNLDGNYCFDSAKNVVIRNSVLNSKDSFWNSENVTCINCTIVGEYLAWNAKNLTFINCKIESHQALCYVQGLKMVHCELINSDLCFEYCSDLDVELISEIESIKNPYSGVVKAPDVKHLYMNEKFVDPEKTKVYVNKK